MDAGVSHLDGIAVLGRRVVIRRLAVAEPRFLLGVQSAAGRRELAAQSGWAVAARPCYVWRLVGPNNRELGRSAQAFTDPATCKAGVSFLRRQLDHLEARVWCDDTARWLWRMELNGTPVATSARAYMRRREAQFNLAQFLAAVPLATSPGMQTAPPAQAAHAAPAPPVASEAAG